MNALNEKHRKTNIFLFAALALTIQRVDFALMLVALYFLFYPIKKKTDSN